MDTVSLPANDTSFPHDYFSGAGVDEIKFVTFMCLQYMMILRIEELDDRVWILDEFLQLRISWACKTYRHFRFEWDRIFTF